VRIITGFLRGRTLPFNSRRWGSIRLTSSKLKEALFAMLGDLQDQRFLDLCSGCGQIGLEAHSRGARVTMNEPDKKRHTLLKNLLRDWQVRNLDLHNKKGQLLISLQEEANQIFEIAYIDPPYHATLEGVPLSLGLAQRLAASKLLVAGGLMLVQHQDGLEFPPDLDGMQLVRQRDYGQTVLSAYRRD
jgi:16S rRNA (guanine966-N2)-methyltransferase